MKKLIPIKKAAMILGVHPETLRRWDNQGTFKAVIVNKRGDRRYDLEEIEKFFTVKKYKKDISKNLPIDECFDCKERPVFKVSQIDLISDPVELCNRHFLILTQHFTKWFLGEWSF